MSEFEELRRAAEAATPGHWHAQGKWIWRGPGRSSVGAADAAYMAATKPRATLALIARVEFAEAARDALVGAVEALADEMESRSKGFSGIYADADREFAAELRALTTPAATPDEDA